jgi:hypothetical protein
MQPVGLGYEKKRQIESEERFGFESLTLFRWAKSPFLFRGMYLLEEELEENRRSSFNCVRAKGVKSPSTKAIDCLTGRGKVVIRR